MTSTLPSFFDTGLCVNASHDSSSTEDISIYSKMVELSYTPPAALPSPLPQTLRIQGTGAAQIHRSCHAETLAPYLGLTLYQGSASVLRSTFTALYGDCSVALERMSVIPGGFRERKVKIDISLQGTSRLTATKAEWNVYVLFIQLFDVTPLTKMPSQIVNVFIFSNHWFNSKTRDRKDLSRTTLCSNRLCQSDYAPFDGNKIV